MNSISDIKKDQERYHNYLFSLCIFISLTIFFHRVCFLFSVHPSTGSLLSNLKTALWASWPSYHQNHVGPTRSFQMLTLLQGQGASSSFFFFSIVMYVSPFLHFQRVVATSGSGLSARHIFIKSANNVHIRPVLSF